MGFLGFDRADTAQATYTPAQYAERVKNWNEANRAEQMAEAYKRQFAQPQGGLLGAPSAPPPGGLLSPVQSRYQLADRLMRSGNSGLMNTGLNILQQQNTLPRGTGQPGVPSAIGSPQKLANGNLGVVVQLPNGQMSVKDTGVPYRQDPSLAEKEQFDIRENERRVAETKRQEEIDRRKVTASYVADAETEASTAMSGLSRLSRAEKLLNTGLTGVGSASTYLPTFWKSPEAQELMTLTNQMVLEESQKMSGALSASDMEFLEKTTISDKFSPETNRRILAAQREMLDRVYKEAKRKYEHYQKGGSIFNYRPSWELPSHVPAEEMFKSKPEIKPKTRRESTPVNWAGGLE